MLELEDREIWGQCSLFAFFAYDTNADVSLLDHAYIIATIPDAQHDLSGVLFYALSDHCFLGWRNSATDNSRGFCGHWVEERSKLVQGYRKWTAIDDQHCVGFHGEFIEFVFERVRVGELLDYEDVLGGGFQSCGYTNTDCGLDFIASDHPNTDASTP